MGVLVVLIVLLVGIYLLVHKSMDYIFAPLKQTDGTIQITEVTDKTEKELNMGEEPSIIVKEPYFNPNKIEGYVGEAKTKKFIFRPKTLKEYIGQEKAKALVKLNIKKIKTLKPVHFLISGWRGCGKTTLAHIIKNSIGAKMIERIAGEIQNPDQITDLVNEINNSPEPYVILFIDEIHALKPNLCENFYSIMEDYRIAGKNIKPFIMIGATTEKNILMNRVAPLVDRFQVQIELEKYSDENIKNIIEQYKVQLFPEKEIAEKHYSIIAKNCKYTPRIAITLLEDNLVEPDIKYVLNCHRIIKDGLTDIDLKILRILEENNRPIGEKALAQMIGISNADYSSLYETYLISREYIIRTSRGRILGKKGKEFLEANK